MAAINSANVPLSMQQVRQDALLQQTKDFDGATTDGKIRKGSKAFEALLLGSWLQQAESSFASVPGGDDDDSQREQIMSFGVQSLATFMAGSGKFGIAEMVAKAMEEKADKVGQTASDSSAETKSRAENRKPGADLTLGRNVPIERHDFE